MAKRRTKAERQAWWYELSPDAKENQIARWQRRKERRRKNRPAKVQAYDKRYPWATYGVDDSNREQWQRTILKKKPWLDSAVFSKKQVCGLKTG